MAMSLKELQNVLGEQIELVRKEGLSPEEKQSVFAQTEYVAKVAKQMINNADIMLRFEIGLSAGKVSDNAAIKDIVG